MKGDQYKSFTGMTRKPKKTKKVKAVIGEGEGHNRKERRAIEAFKRKEKS